jgi:hypothetical protein
MPRRTRYPDPFLGWGSLALQATEMMFASAHVIHHRTSRANSPAQLFEMANEKAQAAIAASHAMTRQLIGMGTGPVSPAHWAALLASGMAPFHSRAVANSKRAARRA